MSVVAENAIASRLLEEAVRLFAHKGYPATSTREIVEAAGVTKPMLYYYFQNKEGMLAAAFAHFASKFDERISLAVRQQEDAVEQLVAVVWAHLDFCQTHKPLARLAYALMFGPDDQRHLVDLNSHKQLMIGLLSSAIARGVAAEQIRSGSEADLLMALRGMISIWVIAAVNDEAELSETLARRIVADLMSGFQRN